MSRSPQSVCLIVSSFHFSVSGKICMQRDTCCIAPRSCAIRSRAQLMKLVALSEVQETMKTATHMECEHIALMSIRDRARALGISEDDLYLSDLGLRNLILEKQLSQLCDPAEVLECLLPFGFALSEGLGGKIPSSIDFCGQVRWTCPLLPRRPITFCTYLRMGADRLKH